MEPLFLSVQEASECTKIGRSTLLDMAYRGEVPSVKIGSRRLFPAEALREWARAQEIVAKLEPP